MRHEGGPVPRADHDMAQADDGGDAVPQEDSPEKQQEAQLRAKYGGLVPRQPGSMFLRKKLEQRKFFDSGDYNMQKGKGAMLGPMAKVQGARPMLQPVADQEEKAPVRSPQHSAAAAVAVAPAAAPPVALRSPHMQYAPVVDTQPQVIFRERRSNEPAPSSPTGMEIPKPETVPQRKSSIIFPNAASKLSPQPLHHTNPPDPLQALHEPRLSAMTE